MSRTTSSWVGLAAGVAAVLALGTACSSGGSSQDDSPARGGGSEASATPSPQPAPVVDQCRRLSFAGVSQPRDASRPVPCTAPHTAQTIKVGQTGQACPSRLLRVLGGDETARRLSRFEVVPFAPTSEEVDRGATWARCDVVALAAEGRLVRLPSTVKGVLDRPDALDTYGTCGTRAPGKPGFARVACRRHHQWRAVDVVDLDRSARYLGPRAAAQGDAECKDVAAARADGALRYTWSFEWPARELWRGGQRYGYCWVPERG